ncbi:DNA-3-methyladenine glycosylase I [Simiduia curdlanivorans]|uniref:DNA-3-methyladenine glycosylase I n=1 Tax=Simiduia curdlanivorans TaxID=1492769 RepID=A0ABV8V3I0_9GAMM|nr:DNA-3-methyladenine glycosylase I [Simiduia curdlanivorans]MDN3637324.1 DNA-3-methyladenine glycosylase I [Simiduia curdlanivorans]
MENKRCEWCHGDELYHRYHDEEWGVPLFDEQRLFEFLLLEGAQAGLSWITVLRKRENYRLAYDNFDPNKLARYSQSKIDKLLQNPGIIRNKLKVNSAVRNAKAWLALKDQGVDLVDYFWRFVDGKPIQSNLKKMSDIPASNAISDALAKQLKKDGFNFVGSTICYAHMQATGMINDHILSCPRHRACVELSKKL